MTSDRMTGTPRRHQMDGSPAARVHGAKATREPRYPLETMTLEEWRRTQQLCLNTWPDYVPMEGDPVHPLACSCSGRGWYGPTEKAGDGLPPPDRTTSNFPHDEAKKSPR